MNDMKDFEKHCRKIGVNLIKNRHVLTNDELYKFYKSIHQDNKNINVVDIDGLNVYEKKIFLELSKNTLLTNKELSNNLDIPIRRVQESTKSLFDKNLITKIINNDKSFSFSTQKDL